MRYVQAYACAHSVHMHTMANQSYTHMQVRHIYDFSHIHSAKTIADGTVRPILSDGSQQIGRQLQALQRKVWKTGICQVHFQLQEQFEKSFQHTPQGC